MFYATKPGKGKEEKKSASYDPLGPVQHPLGEHTKQAFDKRIVIGTMEAASDGGRNILVVHYEVGSKARKAVKASSQIIISKSSTFRDLIQLAKAGGKRNEDAIKLGRTIAFANNVAAFYMYPADAEVPELKEDKGLFGLQKAGWLIAKQMETVDPTQDKGGDGVRESIENIIKQYGPALDKPPAEIAAASQRKGISTLVRLEQVKQKDLEKYEKSMEWYGRTSKRFEKMSETDKAYWSKTNGGREIEPPEMPKSPFAEIGEEEYNELKQKRARFIETMGAIRSSFVFLLVDKAAGAEDPVITLAGQVHVHPSVRVKIETRGMSAIVSMLLSGKFTGEVTDVAPDVEVAGEEKNEGEAGEGNPDDEATP